MLKFINFNNAGSSFPLTRTKKIIISFLKIEENLGGYYAEKKYKQKINKFYEKLSQLINSKKEEISFVPNSTYGWNLLINSLKIKKNENVIICDNEYGSNHIALLNNKIKIRLAKTDSSGQIVISNLLKIINGNTRVVFLCHIASQNGNIMFVEKIGEILKKKFPEILFIVDACQSIGQIPVDVKKIKCDALVGSGRKYLRGPRGTGFIYIKDDIQKRIVPHLLDIHNSKIIKNEKIVNIKSNIFETFEHSPALKLALSDSIENINNIGIYKIQKKIYQLSYYMREKLLIHRDIKFYENIDYLSGINTLTMRKSDVKTLYEFLIKKNILTSISSKQSSINYFRNKKLREVLRVSFHYYNTFKEIDYFCDCIANFIDVNK